MYTQNPSRVGVQTSNTLSLNYIVPAPRQIAPRSVSRQSLELIASLPSSIAESRATPVIGITA